MKELAIPGLFLVKAFVPPEEQVRLIAAIDAGDWITELRRRVQHYGYRYEYGSRRISRSADAPPIPGWARQLIDRMRLARIMMDEPNQLIVNEYVPGQGIAAHVDSPAFGNEILSISLGSPCVMSFSDSAGTETCDILLEPGDLLRLRDEARHEWRHRISARKTDRWHGRTIKRARRLSLTFRNVP